SYVGFEIDPRRSRAASLPRRAAIRNECAFSAELGQFELAVGNPPFVRNQDLPPGWREIAAARVHQRTGVDVSGLANAWQYFAFLAIGATRDDGLVALVLPYEWVS